MFISDQSLSFNKALLYSVIAHLIAVVIMILAPELGFIEKKPKLNIMWVQLTKGMSEQIEQKIKEAKNLPQTTIQQQKKVLEEKKPEKQSDRMKSPEKPIQKRLSKEEIKMQAALASIDKQLKQRKVEIEAAQVKDQGEGFKYGTAENAIHISPDDVEYIKYQAMVRSKIIGEWIIPERYATDTSLSCQYVIMINEDGEIISSTLVKGSENISFDSSAKRAIAKASPLPIPTERLKWEAYNEGFLVEFNPGLKP